MRCMGVTTEVCFFGNNYQKYHGINCDNADGDNNEEMTQVMIRSYNLDMMIKMMMMMITMMMIMRE